MVGLFEQFGIECAQSVEHIAAHMDEVFDSCGLELFCAGGSAGYNEFCTSVEIFKCGGCEFGEFELRRAENHNVACQSQG